MIMTAIWIELIKMFIEIGIDLIEISRNKKACVREAFLLRSFALKNS